MNQGFWVRRAALLAIVSSVSAALLGIEVASADPQFTAYPLPVSKSGPDYMVLGPDGNMWFSESLGNKIGRITLSGEITEFSIPTKNSFPAAIRAGRNKDIWFAEVSGGKIGRISTSGVFHEYAMTTDWRLALDVYGNVWFGESSQRVIARMTPSGVVTKFHLPHSQREAHAMDAAKDGSIWFTEQELTTASTYRGGAVGQCTSQGKITEYVLPNVISDGNEYRALDGAAVSTDGSFWFAEPNNNRIGRRSKTGVFTAYALPTPKSRVIDIVAGKNDDVWFVMGDTDILGHITAQGKVTSYATPDSGGGSGGLAIDPAGNVWFTEYFADKIIKAEVSH